MTANVSTADLTLKSANTIEIVLKRAPHVNAVKDLSERVAALEALGITPDSVNEAIEAQFEALSAETGFLRKSELTQEDYDALTELDPNVLYVIING